MVARCCTLCYEWDIEIHYNPIRYKQNQETAKAKAG